MIAATFLFLAPLALQSPSPGSPASDAAPAAEIGRAHV